jgi:site-specific recombinase XerD
MAVSYHFYQRKDKKRANGEAPIYLRITENRKSKYKSTGIYVEPKHWNSKQEKIRRNHPNYKSLNDILQSEKENAENIQAELSKHGKDSAKAIQARLKKQQTGDFFDLAESYKQELKDSKRLYALKNIKVVLRKLEVFEGSRSLPLKHIDTRWLEGFEGFLKRKYNNRSTTINKNFEPIKAIVQKAIAGHLIAIDPFANFDGAKRGKPEPKTKLSLVQIKSIENLELTKGSKLWHTRNYFLFSFYSGGIRFGDLCCLKWKDIKGNRLSYQMNKNDKVFTIELNHPQKAILNDYAASRKEGDFIFPLLNNHTNYSDPMFLRKKISSNNVLVNKRLKKIVQKVNKKLEEEQSDVPRLDKVSFHVARHSFAQHAVDSGLSLYDLMQALRHSKLETTQRYLKGLDEKLADKAMKKVF